MQALDGYTTIKIDKWRSAEEEARQNEISQSQKYSTAVTLL
jgi:hypothetical protein